MNRRCLGCRTLIRTGSYCQRCTLGTGWGRGRDRNAQARFRAALVARAGNRCEYVDPRTGERCETTRGLRACHFPPLSEGGDYTVKPTDRLYCRDHDKQTDPKAR